MKTNNINYRMDKSMIEFSKYVTGKMLVFSILLSISVVSCMKEKAEPPKSMEQIKKEEGVPVTVSIIEKTGFTKELSYFATLNAIKESIELAKVSDKIVKINAKIGDNVREDQTIIEFPSNNPALQIEQAKAGLDNAEITLKRMKELLAAGEISQQMYDNTYTQFLVSKRNYEQLNQLIVAKAPVSGTIISMPFRVGDVPRHNDVLFTVANTSKMIAKVNVSDREIGFIKKGMPAEVIWNGKVYKGTVALIGLGLSPMTKSFPVEIEINNPGNQLLSGISVEVKIKLSDDSDLIAIDRKFILDESGKKYIFLDDNGKAAKKEIKTGRESGILVEVVSGLNIGDKLISCCTTFLENGIKIKVDNKGNI